MYKYKIPVGWTVYKISSEECYSFGGLSICDDCGQFSNGGYLVPVLNHFMCEDCFNDWKSRAKFYESDLELEFSIISYFEKILTVIDTGLVL